MAKTGKAGEMSLVFIVLDVQHGQVECVEQDWGSQ